MAPDQQLPPGYRQLAPLDSQALAGKRIDAGACRAFNRVQQTVPLTLAEFFPAMRDYPIAFVEAVEGVFLPCVVTGIREHENLFVDGAGDWLAGHYIPAYVRRYPFITPLATTIGENHKQPVLVDASALVDCVDDGDIDVQGLFLFAANGEATEAWRQRESLIAEYLGAEQQSRRFADKLVDLDLLEPFTAQMLPNDAGPVAIRGLYRVNESRLNQLQASKVKALMHGGELSRIYAHLISLDNFARLLDRR